MSQFALKTEQLSKFYSSTGAIVDVNFSLKKGEINVIVGPNGAGKSTFVKLLAGEIMPSQGKIFISGVEKRSLNPRSALKAGIAFVSQDFGLIDTMTIAENLAITNAWQKGLWFSNEFTRLQAKECLAKVGMSLNEKTLVEDLTSFEKQLVAIAKALSTNADLIIFDEPTSVLDQAAFQILKDILFKMRSNGKSIIYVTHKISEAFEIADTISIIKDGRIVNTLPVDQVSKDKLFKYFDISEYSTNKKNGIVKNDVEILKVTDLSTRLLHNISFSIFKNEVVGLVADDYLTAVELVKTIYGIGSRTGTVTINRVNLTNNLKDNIKKRIGLIPDDRRTSGIFNNLNVRDNIGLLQLKKYSKRGIIARKLVEKNAVEKIAAFQIKCESTSQEAKELSGGNQQKVLFARWITFDFDVLILIEPTAGIDLSGKEEIKTIITRLKEQGKSFLIVASDVQEIEALCDRIIYIKNGKITEVDNNISG